VAGRYDRRIDKRPRPYVPGGIKVSMKRKRTDVDGTGKTCKDCALFQLCKKKYPKSIKEDSKSDLCINFRPRVT